MVTALFLDYVTIYGYVMIFADVCLNRPGFFA